MRIQYVIYISRIIKILLVEAYNNKILYTDTLYTDTLYTDTLYTDTLYTDTLLLYLSYTYLVKFYYEILHFIFLYKYHARKSIKTRIL